MKRLAKWLLGSQPEQPPPAPAWPPAAVADILEQFPPGSRVLYYPETKRELRLESVLLGYLVNRKQFVYSPHDLAVRRNGGEVALSLVTPEGETPLSEVHSFQVLIPHQTREEIDFRPAEEGQEAAQFTQSSVNDFARYSLVTLVSHRPFGRVPHLETTVRGATVLSQGFYANQRVAILDPIPQSISYVDKRRHHRVRTRVPLQLRTSPQDPARDCTLDDFSERFLRIRLPEGCPTGELAPGRRLALRLDLEEQGRAFIFQANVFRLQKGTVVVELIAILREGRFVELRVVDELDLKATLLQHPETQRLLRGTTSTPG